LLIFLTLNSPILVHRRSVLQSQGKEEACSNSRAVSFVHLLMIKDIVPCLGTDITFAMFAGKDGKSNVGIPFKGN